MDIYVLDKNTREITGMVDGCESIIWTPRYYEPGDFEVYIRATERNFNLLQIDNFIMRYDDDMIGVIEKVEIETSPETGNYIIASGRCVKSLLARRIVWSMTSLSGTVENGMRRLITENLISPTLSHRKIPNVVLGASQGFTETFEAQYTGDNLLEVVVNLCKLYEYGWRVVLNSEKFFEIQFYKGVDRSYNQSVNPYVVFAPGFQNIISSDYTHDKATLKNSARIGGEGEGTARRFVEIGASISGLDRREMFVDARDVSSQTEEGSTIPASQYDNLLTARGQETLAENPATITFEGEVESTRQYVYGRDYNVGDIVTIQNEYGIEGTPRIIGVIESQEKGKRTIIPTFEEMEVYN